MKLVVLASLCLPAFCQAPPPQSQPATSPTGSAARRKAPPPPKPRTVLGIKPGEAAIKNKDFYDATGYFHPFRRMPRFIWQDQKAIWTSPFHTSKKNAKWWAIFGGLTGALIATDKYTETAAPNTKRLVTLGDAASQLGATYTLIPLTAGFYLAGTHWQNTRFREAGLLSFEALTDVFLVDTAFKVITQRERPYVGNGEGDFFTGIGTVFDRSFPSGHAISTMALASVFAHEYHDKLWVKILAYSYAGAVEGARLAANKHFPGDVIGGGAIGWFVGDYVYAKRHNPDVGHKPSISERILDHVHFGMSFE
jgi:membrane-associated phospholipid phosphatase